MMGAWQNRRGTILHGHVLRVVEDFEVVQFLFKYVIPVAVPSSRLRHGYFCAVVADNVGERKAAPKQRPYRPGCFSVEQDMLDETNPRAAEEGEIQSRLIAAAPGIRAESPQFRWCIV